MGESALEKIRQARKDGWFGKSRVLKVWTSAQDAGVCPGCAADHGVKVRLNARFPATKVQEPPAHDGCRCVLTFETEDD
jgi:hypothetical protein